MKNCKSHFIMHFGFVMFILNQASSQSPAVEWDNTLGGFYGDYVSDIIQTPDNGFILAGRSGSGICPDKSEAAMGSYDFWIIKLNEDGETEIENTIGGEGTVEGNNGYDACISIVPTADGNYMLAGYSNSGISGDKTQESKGLQDYWLVKIDGALNILWQSTIGGNNYDYMDCMIRTSDNGYLIAGHSESGSTGDKTEGNKGLEDYWVIKLNSAGSIVWQNAIGGNNVDVTVSVAQTTDGGYIIGGYSKSGISGDKSEANLGLYDYWIVKLNTSGNIVWQNTIGGSGDDLLASVVATDDGGCLIGGASGSGISGDKTEANMGYTDFWILKLNASGNIVWQNTIGGSNNDDLHSIQKTMDGNYLITGHSHSEISGDKTIGQYGTFAGYPDYWLMQIDNSGNIIWQGDYGGYSSDAPSITRQNADGGYIIGGYSISDAGGSKSEDCLNGNDIWVLKLSASLFDNCLVPSNLSASNIQSTHVNLNWDDVIEAESYKLYYRVTGAGAWIKKSAASPKKTLNGLTPNTNYEYKIRSNCGGELTAFSPVETFTTLPLRDGEMTKELNINVYPNPATDQLIVEVGTRSQEPGTTTNSQIAITGITGKIVFRSEIISSVTAIDLSEFAAGMYMITIQMDGEKQTQKFIKQ